MASSRITTFAFSHQTAPTKQLPGPQGQGRLFDKVQVASARRHVDPPGQVGRRQGLSPAINDPTTAVQAIDRIQHLLLCLAGRQMDNGHACDAAGNLRLVYGTPNWPDFVALAVDEIRHFGAGSLQVIRRLRAMLERLCESVPEPRRPPLRAELALLGKAVQRTFVDEEDRRRAMEADYQGIGGSG